MLMDPVVISAEIIGDPGDPNLAQDDVSRLVCSFVPWCLPWPSWPRKSLGARGVPKISNPSEVSCDTQHGTLSTT